MNDSAQDPASAHRQDDPDPDEMAQINVELELARDLLGDGKKPAALDICVGLLKRENLPLRSASTLSLLMRRLGQTEAADQIREVVLAGVDANMDNIQDSIQALLPVAESVADLGSYELAERLVRRAHEIAPDNLNVIASICAFLIQRQRTDEARAIAMDFAGRTGDTFEILLYLSVIFGHFKADTEAAAFLEKARPHCKTTAQRSKLNYLLAAGGTPAGALDQHGMAVELFDGFAESYDAKLTALGNNGPSLVFSALDELGLKKDASRRILDAGCGTGLCAGFLRDYAATITGVDLSIKMLEKAREKRLYDTLARTDLSVPATYPEGRFDMIVCADVLVYFGALDDVLRNFRNVLNPGGWLILTVEDEMDPTVTTGFKLYSSGRHKHSDAYLLATLGRAGFPKPKLMEHARIRNEMSDPILGTVVAVQKSALLTG